MYRLLPCIFALSATIGNAQGWNWATAFLGTGETRVEAVAALADGGALVCGEFNDTLRTSADTIVTHGDQDGFLARLDNSGAVLWLKAIGSEQYEELNDIVVDANGNAYAAGTFSGTVDWNGTDITGGAGREAVLVKFDVDGNVLWYRRAVGYSYAYTVSVSSNGTAFLGGVINSSVVFSGTTITNNGGIFNAFIVQYTADDGDLIDADVVSGSSGDFGAYGMDVDDDGNVYFTGYSRPQQNPYVGTFMAKVAFGSGTGWSNTVSSAFGDLYGRDVSVTNDGHVYFTGNIYNNVTWMDQPLGHYGWYKNAYLARFTTDGALDWVQQIGSTGDDQGLGVVADGLGSAYWTGGYYGQADFDTIHVATQGLFSNKDVFVAYTEPAGGAAFVNTAVGPNSEEFATCIDKRVNGPVIVGGAYSSFETHFGATVLPSPGGQRCFVASMSGPDDDLTTAVPSATLTSSLHLYPVPANDALFIAMNGAKGNVICTVIDQQGRTVLNATLGAPLGSIAIGPLAPGLYTLRCADAEGRLQVERFVKER